jgi:hypothetical protein
MKKLLLILLLVCSVGFSQTGPQITQVRTFANLAALRATAPTATGTWAYTRGYSTSGDGESEQSALVCAHVLWGRAFLS